LKTSAHDTIDVLHCDRRMTIYTTTVYDGTCTYSIQRSYMDIALTYMGDWVVFRDFRARPWNCRELNLIPLSLTLFVAAFLGIACMGMFMIMVRSAYVAVDDSEEDGVAFKQGHAMDEPDDDYED
jgi:hypothetical protein